MADAKQASLTVLGGPLTGAQAPLPSDGVVTIGAAADCTFPLSVASVKPLHATIVVEGGRATVYATDDESPLYINDSPLGGSAELRNGDILWLGSPGEEDVVMLQCILPPVPEEAPSASSLPAAPTPEVETQALWATGQPGTTEAPPTESPPEAAAGEATVAFVPESSPDAEASPPAGDPAADDGPLILAFDAPAKEEEEEGVLVDEPTFTATDDDAPVVPAESAPPEEPTFVGEEPTFVGEDESVAEPAPTLVTGPDDMEVPAAPPTVALPAESAADEVPIVEPLVEPPAPTVVTPEELAAPTVVPPEPPAPAPPPAPASPEASTPAAVRPRDRSAGGAEASTRRARPASLRKGPKPPPRPAPEEAPADQVPQEGSSRSPALLAVAGFVGVLVVGGLGFAVWRFVLAKPSPAPTPVPIAAATAAPPPVAPTTAPPVAPTPETALDAAPAATPTPLPVATPTPAAPEPARPTPTPRAAPTPTPTPPPAPEPAAPAQPSAAELQAQQNAARVQELLGLADTAVAARQYEAAVGHLDEALRLEPANSRATTARARAVALRDLARRQFVAGRTRVQTAKAQGGGGLAGFDTGGTDLRQAPDFQGRIEFEMTPPSGIAAGDPWTLRIFVVNDGKKSIEVQGVTATTRINGNGSDGPVAPQTRQIRTQQRVLVGEASGTWSEGTTAWSTQVTVTAKKGDSLRATLTWK